MSAEHNASDNAKSPESTPTGAAYYALGVLTIVYSFNFIDRQLLAILQESIKADLGLKDSHLGLLPPFMSPRASPLHAGPIAPTAAISSPWRYSSGAL